MAAVKPACPEDEVEALRALRTKHLDARDKVERQIKPLLKRRNAHELAATQTEELIGEKLIEMWGDKPDWSQILPADHEGGMTLYRYGNALIEALGLSRGTTWGDNKETVIAFGLNRYDDAERLRVERSLRYLAPFMKPRRGNVVWFQVNHRDHDQCAWTLIFGLWAGRATLEQQVFGTARERIKFETLGAALAHVQEHLWNDDEMPLSANGPAALAGPMIEITAEAVV